MEKTIITCLSIAAAAFVVWAVSAIVLRYFKKKSWLLCIVLALVCGAAIYYPIIENIMFADNIERANFDFIYKTLLSFYRSSRLFLVDGNFPELQTALIEVLDAIEDYTVFEKNTIMQIYQGIAILVYLWSPIATATVLASIFKDLLARFRLRTICAFARERYIFSDLNDKSLALAKDIRNTKNKKRLFKSVIVFHDVYRKNEEVAVELLDEAKNIGALCFKRDITKVRYYKWLPWIKTEFFVIGENESENIKQTLELVKKYKTHSNKKVYVWARSPESSIILDSVQITEDVASCNFVLRRIDDVEIFVWNTLKDANLFDKSKIYIDDNGEKYISILIVGMGEYGMEFLKTATWMYQFDDINLEITAIDLKAGAEKALTYQCPEMMNFNNQKIPGEARYGIKFIENLDIFTPDLINKITKETKVQSETEDPSKAKTSFDEELYERLKRVNTVFVTLGDDDLNIRGAIEMRQLFDFLHYEDLFRVATDRAIYNLAYKFLSRTGNEGKKDVDAKIADEISKLSEDELKNYAKNEIKDQLAKDTKIKEINDAAIEKRFKVEIAKQLKSDYDVLETPKIYAPVYDIVKTENMIGVKNPGKNAKEIPDKRLRCYENTPYNIDFEGSFEKQYNYETVVREELESIALAYHLKWSTLDNYDQVVENFNKYNQYEYYRRSSISQAMHIQLLTADERNNSIADEVTCEVYKDKNKGLTEELENAVKILRKQLKKRARAKNTKKIELAPEFCKAIERLNQMDKCDNRKTITIDGKEKFICTKTQQECKSARRATIEHIRWNAYMRSIGYRAPKDGAKHVKLPRAKMHCDIIEFDRLDKETKAKDGITP